MAFFFGFREDHSVLMPHPEPAGRKHMNLLHIWKCYILYSDSTINRGAFVVNISNSCVAEDSLMAPLNIKMLKRHLKQISF